MLKSFTNSFKFLQVTTTKRYLLTEAKVIVRTRKIRRKKHEEKDAQKDANFQAKFQQLKAKADENSRKLREEKLRNLQ
jgi:ABC-type branched-subunit amino acid transport system ATPase component